MTTTASHVGGPREAVAHSAGRAQRAVGVEAAFGAGVALALGARSHTRYLRPLCDPKRTRLFSSQRQVSTAYLVLVSHNYSMFVLFALVQAAPHSHALSGQRHKVAQSWSLASDFPGLDAHFSAIAWTLDTSLVLHFQGSLCMVVAVHSLRSLESAELCVFITQQLP